MSIRNHVSFRHPAEFVPASAEDGIVSTQGAAWFVDLLRKIPRLVLDADLCQEDWGVVVFGTPDRFGFWLGLSFWEEGAWLAHVHHDGLLQRFRAAGKAACAQVIADLHVALSNDVSVADVTWYHEAEVARGRGAPSPDAAP